MRYKAGGKSIVGTYQQAQAISFQRFFRAWREEVCKSLNDSKFDVGRKVVDGVEGSGGGSGSGG